jgi:hypothetical protein
MLSIAVLAFFASQSTLAYAFVAVDHAGESCPDDERDCKCPLDCSWGCCAARVPGVPVSPVVPDFLVPWILEPLTFLPERAPPSVEPREVLHVPKTLLA